MKRTLSFLLMFLLFAALLPSCFADGETKPGSILNALEAADFSRTDDEAWNHYIDLLFDHDDIDPEKLCFGYYNMETGEEYYHNGDEYFIAASLYKVPLNMVFSDTQSEHYVSLDSEIGGAPYSYYQESTLIHSQNNTAETLWNYLGGYGFYKQFSAQYLTDELDSLPPKYYENNFFTAKQFIYCLKMLCQEPDRFPGIIDCMLQAAPDTHFRRDVMWCPIASKPGYVTEEGYHTVANDMGIVYTTETFAIVMMTDNVPNFGDVLADYCTLMCDFTNTRKYARDEKKAAEEEARLAAEQAEKEAEAAALAAKTPSPEEAPSASSGEDFSVFPHLWVLAVIAVLLAVLLLLTVFYFRKRKSYQSRH